MNASHTLSPEESEKIFERFVRFRRDFCFLITDTRDEYFLKIVYLQPIKAKAGGFKCHAGFCSHFSFFFFEKKTSTATSQACKEGAVPRE